MREKGNPKTKTLRVGELAPLHCSHTSMGGCCIISTRSAEEWERAGWCARLTLVLVAERSRGAASAFAPYLASIPTRVPVPCVWPPACVASLHGTDVQQVPRPARGPLPTERPE